MTEDTELTFEFGIKPARERREMRIADLREVPFQVQIAFTRRALPAWPGCSPPAVPLAGANRTSPAQ